MTEWMFNILNICLFSSFNHKILLMQLWAFGCTGPLSRGIGRTIPMYPRLEGEENFYRRGGCRRDIETSVSPLCTRFWNDAKCNREEVIHVLFCCVSVLTSAAPPPGHTLWAGSWRSRPGPGHRGPNTESDWSTAPLENSLRKRKDGEMDDEEDGDGGREGGRKGDQEYWWEEREPHENDVRQEQWNGKVRKKGGISGWWKKEGNDGRDQKEKICINTISTISKLSCRVLAC